MEFDNDPSKETRPTVPANPLDAPSAFHQPAPAFDNANLNPQQREAVNQIEGPLLILAGPGSGKTRVITQRIANMIAHDIPSYSIVALTFTNKAADEMRKRLQQLAPDNQAWTGTFHRFCSRLLRNYANMVGLAENFSIFDSSDSKKLVKQAIANASAKAKVDLKHYTPDRLTNEISSIKNAGITVEQFTPRPGHALDQIVAKVYPEYQNLLRLSNGVDFDDLLLHSVDLLRHSSELRSALDRRYAYMMVDEYQDTNTAQYQLIRLLNYDFQNLAVTGDPDQSIYGWRGANLNNILEFERDYPDVKVVRLEQNYRSTQSVLTVADQLISNNVRRKKKSLITDNEEGQPVRLVTYFKPEDEAADIADSIALSVNRNARSFRDFAILYRTNYLSRALEHAFRRRGLPYQIVRGHEFYQRKEIKDVIGYLHLLNNPSDGVAFDRVINVPPRKIGKVTMNRLADWAVGNNLSLLEAARRADEISTISAAPSAKLKKFVEMIDDLSRLSGDEVPRIIRNVLETTGYREWLTLDGTEEGHERASNVDELIVAAEEFERDFAEEGGLERYLEQAALVSDTDAFQPDAEFVTMMSLHAAKGLEFPCVFIVGLEEGILPHERSAVDEEQIEEERRLLFVGITRAESELQLSRCVNRFRRGSHWPVIPSRFLMELPRELMDVSEPRSQSNYHDQDFGGSHDFNPYGDDDLPSIDINAIPDIHDDGDADFDPFAENLGRLADSKSQRTNRIDAVVDRSDSDTIDETFEEDAPRRLSKKSAKNPNSLANNRKPLGGADAVREAVFNRLPQLKTAAELAKEQAGTVRLNPDSFEIGMSVQHADYGTGEIVDLAGEGKKRMATIAFAEGPKKFKLAFTNLRSL